MQVVILNNANKVAEHASHWVIELLKEKVNPVLGLATGSTPISLYQALVEKHKLGQLDFSGVTTFNLDEYHNIDENNDGIIIDIQKK